MTLHNAQTLIPQSLRGIYSAQPCGIAPSSAKSRKRFCGIRLVPRALLIPQTTCGIISAYLSQINPAEWLIPQTLCGIRFTAQQSQKPNPAIPQPLHGVAGLENPELHDAAGENTTGIIRILQSC